MEALLKLKSPNNAKELKSFLGAIQYSPSFPANLSETNRLTSKYFEKFEPWKWENGQEEDFMRMKRILTENPCLGRYAKDLKNLITTDASKTGLRITLWQKQDNGDITPLAFGSRNMNHTEKTLHW